MTAVLRNNKRLCRLAPYDTRKKNLDREQIGGMSLTVLGVQFSRLTIDKPNPGQDKPDADHFNQSDGLS